MSFMSMFGKRFFHPLIQTHPACLGSRDNLGVQIRGNPDVESPGEALEGGHPTFFTGLEVNFKRLPAFPQQTFYISSVKVCASGKTQEFPTKHTHIRVESNNSFMPVDLHYIFHGFTPCCSNHLRILATAPLSVSGLGWGPMVHSNLSEQEDFNARAISFSDLCSQLSEQRHDISPADVSGRWSSKDQL